MSDDRLKRLEQRIQLMEDTAEIYNLIGAYGPAVDSDSRIEASEQWTPDGVYDVYDGLRDGRQMIVDGLAAERHQSWLEVGCAHHISTPRVTVSGDVAVAVAYMSVITPGDTRDYVVRSQTVNRWELVRTAEGWRVSRRTIRQIGTDEARALLRRSVTEDR